MPFGYWAVIGTATSAERMPNFQSPNEPTPSPPP
jgi:hypothetical protein